MSVFCSKLRIFQMYDNSHVVPYNAYLLMKYNCHVNVEICSAIQVVKYLFKYVYKGSDKAMLKLRQEKRDLNGGVIDEVSEHLDARYLCPPEGFHRLFAFELQGKSNAVVDLSVHEKNQHTIVFQPGQEAAAADRNKDSTLLAFFKFNGEAVEMERQGRLAEMGPVDPRTVPYYKYPEHFTFVKVRMFL